MNGDERPSMPGETIGRDELLPFMLLSATLLVILCIPFFLSGRERAPDTDDHGMSMDTKPSRHMASKPAGRKPAVDAHVAASVAQPLNKLDTTARQLELKHYAKVRSMFKGSGCVMRGSELTLIALKDELRLELWCRDASDAWRHLKDYDILGASGRAGPKLRQGDRQVPEGVYEIVTFNPDSAYHLSMRLNYPNAFDMAMAERDGRDSLGGDIYVHGNRVSMGCLAIGDGPIEELFYIAYSTGRDKIRFLIAPHDFRKYSEAPRGNLPQWSGELYDTLRLELAQYRA